MGGCVAELSLARLWWALVGALSAWGGWGCLGMGSRVVVCTKSCALPEVRPLITGFHSPAVPLLPSLSSEYLHCPWHLS